MTCLITQQQRVIAAGVARFTTRATRGQVVSTLVAKSLMASLLKYSRVAVPAVSG